MKSDMIQAGQARFVPLDALQGPLLEKGDDRMATASVKQTTPVTTTESVEQHFRRLEALWNAETGYLSSDTEIVGHPAFREIISIGEAVVPLMMKDLAERASLWVWALPEITGADPVPPPDRGNIRKMSHAWLQWGRERGYQW